MARKRIGEYLVDARLVTPEQVQRALDLQALQLPGTDALTGSVLLQLGIIQEHDIALALSQQQGEQASLTNSKSMP
jgi:type IV pilus assembly protein PilB